MNFHARVIAPITRLVTHFEGEPGYKDSALPIVSRLPELVWATWQDAESGVGPDLNAEQLLETLDSAESLLQEDDLEGRNLWREAVDVTTQAVNDLLG